MAKKKQEVIDPETDEVQINTDKQQDSEVKIMTFEQVILHELRILNAQVNEIRQIQLGIDPKLEPAEDQPRE